jgi:hypothetical protein
MQYKRVASAHDASFVVFTGEARPPSEVTILIDCDES